MKFKCKCGELATWTYMPSNDGLDEDNYYCDNCVPRGCSCNNESVCYHDEENDIEELEIMVSNFKQDILENSRNFKLLNFFSKNHDSNYEEIKDKKLIKVLINNLSNEQIRHLELIPLDENGREFPCCEYWYNKDGWDNE